MLIELVRTIDDEHGPFPPRGDGWHIVKRSEGYTLWRRIRISVRNQYAATSVRTGYPRRGKCI